MGRKYLNHIPYPMSDERSSLGDTHVDNAVHQLKKTAELTATVMTSYTPTREKTIAMLFRDDDIAAAERVRGLVTASGSTRSYPINLDKQEVDLNINYYECPVVALDAAAMCPHSDRIQPLLTFIDEVRAVHDRFEELKAVLKWFNRKATAGACRAYWPTAMKLTPKSKAWEDLQGVPSRYSEPPHVGDWLQAIRDSAQTFTQSLMLPTDVDTRPRNHMWLTFKSRTVVLSDNASYQTDMMTYNL